MFESIWVGVVEMILDIQSNLVSQVGKRLRNLGRNGQEVVLRGMTKYQGVKSSNKVGTAYHSVLIALFAINIYELPE
jgi:hypothetical protein